MHLLQELNLKLIHIHPTSFATFYTAVGKALTHKHLLIDKLNLTYRELLYIQKLLRSNLLALDYCILVKNLELRNSLLDRDDILCLLRFLGGQHVQLLYHDRMNNVVDDILIFKEILERKHDT